MTEPGPVERIRETPRRRRLVAVAAVLVGLALATVHWLGLVAGGALVALVARTPARGLVAGFGFGVVVLAVFLAGPLLAGRLGRTLGAGLPAVLAVVAPLALGTLGGLARAVE